MKHVSILVPEGAVLSAITDARYMFTAVNMFAENAGQPAPFQVQLVSASKEIKLNDGLFSVHCDALLEEIRHSDLILVPAIGHDIPRSLQENRAFLPWIVQQYKGGAEVASMCIGAFLLAATGLMNGKACSTHWMFTGAFQQMFPEVNLCADKIITEQNGLYSSGGATSYWNLLLYLVEKYTDRAMAVQASKFFLLEIGRNSQSPFIMFRGQKEHDDELVKKAQEFIEANYRERITVDELCDQLETGRRTFERRFKKATNNSIVGYIQRVKIEAAKKQLESNRKTVNEVMYETGYSDTKAFRDVFKKITGMSPVEYRNKYTKELSN